jgi:hypothetical protein
MMQVLVNQPLLLLQLNGNGNGGGNGNRNGGSMVTDNILNHTMKTMLEIQHGFLNLYPIFRV